MWAVCEHYLNCVQWGRGNSRVGDIFHSPGQSQIEFKEYQPNLPVDSFAQHCEWHGIYLLPGLSSFGKCHLWVKAGWGKTPRPVLIHKEGFCLCLFLTEQIYQVMERKQTAVKVTNTTSAPPLLVIPRPSAKPEETCVLTSGRHLRCNGFSQLWNITGHCYPHIVFYIWLR